MELYLNFTNEDGEDERIAVKREKFFIGRHSENDLCIPNPKLSREHIQIERLSDTFAVSDCRSSNGTKLNGDELIEPETLTNGDRLDLGGGLKIEIEFIHNGATAQRSGQDSKKNENLEFTAGSNGSNASATGSSSVSVSSNTAVSSTSDFGFGKMLLLAPILGIVVILFVGGALLLFGGKITSETARDNPQEDFESPIDQEDNIDDDPTPTSKIAIENTTTSPVPINTPSQTSNSENTVTETNTPKPATGAEKIESLALSFMKRIARNDPNPVLTGPQLAVINAKTKQFRSSSALASNIKNAKEDSSKIAALATSKGLKPQFVATAALAKLGSTRGNVAATAQGMINILYKLKISINDEFANESLIIIAAYNQGVANQNLKMRNLLALMTKKNPASARQIRTIWFLKDKGKLTNAQFEFALRFLAIGTITQNPKAFNVSSQALTF